MRVLSLCLVLAVGLVAPELRAQVRPGIYGYLVRGQNGQAGEFCRVFDCVPRPLPVKAGETLTLTVNAPWQSPYGIVLSPSATGCVPLPGIANLLILGGPFYTLTLGIVSQPSPILSCWGGKQDFFLPLPASLPVGFQFATQAVAIVPLATGGDGPAFSVAVEATVR